MFGAGFKYRKLHYIQGSSAGVQYNYPVMFRIYYGAGTDSGAVVYLNNLARTGIPDIRFTTLNGTPCQYWIEHPDYGQYANVWVNIPTIPMGGCGVYILYGNSVCVSASNPNLTFLFFDDFDGGALDTSKWAYTGSAAVSGSIKYMDPSNTISSLYSWDNLSTSVRTRMSPSKVQWGNCATFQVGCTEFGSRQSGGSFYTLNTWNCSWANVQETVLTHNASLSGYNNWHVYYFGTGVSCYVNDILEAYNTNYYCNSSYQILSGIIGSGTIYADWIFVTKYANPEPAHGAWLPMETSLQPLSKAYDQRGDPQ